MLEALAKLDAEWPEDPAVPDLACELAVTLGVSANSAAERLRIARAVRDLPHIAGAHREGRLSWDQLRWVTRVRDSCYGRGMGGARSRVASGRSPAGVVSPAAPHP